MGCFGRLCQLRRGLLAGGLALCNRALNACYRRGQAHWLLEVRTITPPPVGLIIVVQMTNGMLGSVTLLMSKWRATFVMVDVSYISRPSAEAVPREALNLYQLQRLPRGCRLPAAPHIKKPVHMDVLMSALEELLPRAPRIS